MSALSDEIEDVGFQDMKEFMGEGGTYTPSGSAALGVTVVPEMQSDRNTQEDDREIGKRTAIFQFLKSEAGGTITPEEDKLAVGGETWLLKTIDDESAGIITGMFEIMTTKSVQRDGTERRR